MRAKGARGLRASCARGLALRFAMTGRVDGSGVEAARRPPRRRPGGVQSLRARERFQRLGRQVEQLLTTAERGRGGGEGKRSRPRGQDVCGLKPPGPGASARRNNISTRTYFTQ